MTRTMHDGINTDAQYIKSIIKPGDLVAYYIDGRYAWTLEEIELFPDNTHVTITITGNNPADVVDCETGDADPVKAANWVYMMKNLYNYERPTIYRSLSVMEDVRKSTGELVMGKDWDAWVADYDNSVSNVYPGSAAKQYENELHQDVSVVYDDAWPHRSSVIPVTLETLNSIVISQIKWPNNTYLSFGDRGPRVEALQTALRRSGIRGVRGIANDGIFGSQTQTAVRNFEASQHIPVDQGIAGPQVRASLFALGLLDSSGRPR